MSAFVKLSGISSGGKVTNHQKITRMAAPIILRAKALEIVRKIVIARLCNTGSNRRRVVVRDVPAGLFIRVAGDCVEQELYLYTPQREQTRLALQDLII